jgi:RNA polymerase sigma-70 factor (ECF subfamily)
MSDADLVARARSGERAALECLVERHYDDCWRYAHRMLGNHADAEDAVQDTFVRAFSALDRYRERERFRSWLFTILVNQCRNALVGRRRRMRRFLPSEAAAHAAEEVATTRPVELPDDELAHAIARLDPQQREALLLKYGEGLEYSEISRLTGASESALKMRVKRGTERLRALLLEPRNRPE